MPTTVILGEFSLIVKCGKEEHVVPYASIIEVTLSRERDKVFKASLRADGERPIVVTNRYFQSAGNVEDRSRGYSTFIRVLHFHLKDKSKASFTSGIPSFSLGFRILIIALVSFIISFVADYMGFRLLGPVIQGIVLTILLGMLLIGSGVARLPRTYRPTDIPMEFLP